MKKFHIALSVKDIEISVQDYSKRLECEPTVVIENEYALWRTNTLNFSIRKAENPGTLRHVGWEDDEAKAFDAEKDVNGILWERFTESLQAQEIENMWPGSQK
ncbi:hypothetical protein K1X76_06775 [bacterium]|nr:hypothetical protein [bacterium]